MSILSDMQEYMEVMEHVKKIHDNKLKVYKISKELPTNQGFLLMELFEHTIKEVRDSQEKLHKIRQED